MTDEQLKRAVIFLLVLVVVIVGFVAYIFSDIQLNGTNDNNTEDLANQTNDTIDNQTTDIEPDRQQQSPSSSQPSTTTNRACINCGNVFQDSGQGLAYCRDCMPDVLD